MSSCIACGEELRDTDRFCPNCGASVEEEAIQTVATSAAEADANVSCAACGAEVAAQARYCTKCGQPVGSGPAVCSGQPRTDEPDPPGPSAHSGKRSALGRRLVIVAALLVAAFVLIVDVPSFMQNRAAQNRAKAPVRSFVRDYGTRYNDAVSTYYATQAYRKATGVDLVMTKDYITNYDPLATTEQGPTSTLGFERYSLPVDAKIDIATCEKIFDEYIAKELTLYMNLIAKNPNATDIIDSQFTNFLGPADTDHADRDYTVKLMESAKVEVAKHGSSANYKVEPISDNDNDYSNPNVSYIDNIPSASVDIMETDKYGTTTWFALNARVGVEIDTYKGQTVSQSADHLWNSFKGDANTSGKEDTNAVRVLELSVIRHYNPGNDYSATQTSIGLMN
jgi:hypothetical protein